LVDAAEHAAKTVMFATDPHPKHPAGWVIAWGTQLDVRTINLDTDGAITDGMVAGYLAKYATKATEATGHTSRKLTAETIDVFADPDGTHTQRLVDACWILGGPAEWRSLRRWAHMLGFGGHFLTKSRYYSVTFRFLREQRAIWQRTIATTGPEQDTSAELLRLVVEEVRVTGWNVQIQLRIPLDDPPAEQRSRVPPRPVSTEDGLRSLGAVEGRQLPPTQSRPRPRPHRQTRHLNSHPHSPAPYPDVRQNPHAVLPIDAGGTDAGSCLDACCVRPE
jgi:hypothetical protein